MSRISVRHCSKLYRSKLKNVQVVEKIIKFSVKLNQSKDEARPVENCRKIIPVEFLNRSKPTKMFRVSVQHSYI